MSEKIFRGNTLAVRRQIARELGLKLDAADQYTAVAVSSNTSPALADIKPGSVFHNTSASTRTITLPNTGLPSHIGLRFHFTASTTWSSAVTVTAESIGLMRDKSNGAAPFTVTDGTLTVTVTGGLGSFAYYAVSGEFT